jgi:hypothetical protein
VPPAQVSRSPVELAQAVENRPFDAVLRIAGEHNLFVGTVLRYGIEQSENSRVDQVIQLNVDRQILMDTDRDGADEWEVFEDDPIAGRAPLRVQVLPAALASLASAGLGD